MCFKLRYFLMLSLLGILAASQVWAKNIGSEPPPRACCSVCYQSTGDAPGGVGHCPEHGACSSGGCGMSIEKGKLGDSIPLFSAQAANGVGLDFSMHYASYNADGEKAILSTVSGFGWSHSYNIFLFSQRRSLFKMSPTGLTTQYKRVGRRGPLAATRGHQQTVVENPDGSVEIANNNQLTFRFESIPNNPLRVAGNPPLMLTRITDRNGNTTQLTYVDGLLDTVKGPFERQIRFEYDAQNRLTRITDPAGRQTTFNYDAAGNLTRITDPLGQSTTYQYNVLHQITRKTDRNGHSWQFEYNAGNHPTGIRDNDGNPLFSMSNSSDWATDLNALFREKERVYLPSTTTLTDGRGNPWQYDYDSDGLITHMAAPDGATTRYHYDPVTLNADKITDANDHVTLFEYDAKANLLKRTDHLGNVTTFEYEPAFNMMTKMTDANGRQTTFEYDAFGNRIKETDPLGFMRSWTYDGNGNVVTETDKNGHTTTYEYDAFGNRTKITDAEGNMTTMTYDIMGNLLTRTDDNNHTTTFAYDALDRLIKETDPASQVTLTEYDPEGNRVKVTDRNGNSTTFEYDVRDRLVKTTDALGGMETFSYDNNDNRVAMTDKNVHASTFEYDVQNRLIKTTDAEGFMTSRMYDPVGNVIKETGANGHSATMMYDELNRLIKTTDAEANVTLMEYDMVGLVGCPECTGPTKGSSLVTRQTDGEGKVTYFKYDGLDRLIIQIRKQTDLADLIDSDDAVTVWTYDPVGNRLSMTEPNGNTMTWEYDSIDRMIKETNAAGDMTITSYDGVGNVKTVTAPNGNVTTNNYDALDRLIQVDDSIGRVANFSYDPEGNRLTERDGNDNGPDFLYDAIYRVIKVTDALGEMTVFAYDPVGNLLTVTDREGNVTTHLYDDINRRTKTTDAINAMTSFEYDGVGNLKKITDANGHATEYDYDGINRLIKETYADGGMRTFTYNGVSNLRTRTDQQGQTTTYSYTDLHFLAMRDYPTSGDDRFSYDLSGRMLSACREGSPDDLPADSCAGWLVTFDYDGANRVTETVQNGKTVGYVYDIPGRIRTLTYPGGRVIVETTDARARLDEVNDGGLDPIAEYDYDLGNRVGSRTYRNDVVASYSYNANNWILQLSHDKGASQIAGFRHEYDNEGNKRFEGRLHQPVRSEAYDYDNIYRLIDYKVGNLVGSTVPVPTTQTQYDLDLVGNWDQKTTDAVVETRMHSPTNEITEIDAIPISHDDNGNTEEDARYTYDYDEENRLTEVIRKSDSRVVGQYQYDALSRRVVKVADPFAISAPVETRYFYDDARVIEEQDVAMNILATYVYGNYIDEVLTMDRGGSPFYYHQNSLWSVAAVTDGAANIVEQYAYDAYGLVMVTDGAGAAVPENAWGTPHSAIGNPYLFTGRRLDEETGLYYYRARVYDPEKGRFLQRDPLGPVDSLNLYQYALSVPTSLLDAFGLSITDKPDRHMMYSDEAAFINARNNYPGSKEFVKNLKSLKEGDCPKVKVHYIDGEMTMLQFATDIKKHVKCTISLFFGHGASQPSNPQDPQSRSIANREALREIERILGETRATPRRGIDGCTPVVGVYSCFQSQYMERIAKPNRLTTMVMTNEPAYGWRLHQMFNQNWKLLKKRKTKMCSCCKEEGGMTLHLYFGALGPKSTISHPADYQFVSGDNYHFQFW